MYEELMKQLRNCLSDKVEDCDKCPYQGGYKGLYCMDGLITEATNAIESLKHTVEILCGIKINLVRCCECIYHDDKNQYHYCRKWRRNCPNDSDFFCKWGEHKDEGQDK